MTSRVLEVSGWSNGNSLRMLETFSAINLDPQKSYELIIDGERSAMIKGTSSLKLTAAPSRPQSRELRAN